ncbi:MAG: zinc ABC transporter substrate-binding protein [Elusimicrobiota bacterium]|jgi:zinc transport system substrate-binding protein|nr:zinc ABC transporter substrate-binding protein [Elusimicrobiota bacterium]
MFGRVVKFINTTALCAVVLFFIACNNGGASAPEAGAQKLKAVVSGYAPYAIAEAVLKDAAALQMLVPPGTEAHSFEPTPQNAAAIQNADFFFFTSGRMEPWAMEISDGRGIALAYELPNNNPKDPHVWMDFDNTLAMANNMAMYVARKYPQLEAQLLQNTSDFNRQIQMLKRLYGQTLANCQTRDIYHVGHSAFGYIARNYNLNFKPLIGATFEGEPSARDMAQMIKEIKTKNLSYIFTEEVLNSRLAEVISKESGARLLNLYTIEGVSKEEFENKTGYRRFMMLNLQNLSKGLSCA